MLGFVFFFYMVVVVVVVVGEGGVLCEHMHLHVIIHAQRSEATYWPLPSTLCEQEHLFSNAFTRLVAHSPVFNSHVFIGMLELQMCATMPGFIWVLRIRIPVLTVCQVFYLPNYLCSTIAWLFKGTVDNISYLTQQRISWLQSAIMEALSLALSSKAFDLKMYSKKATSSLGLSTKYPKTVLLRTL